MFCRLNVRDPSAVVVQDRNARSSLNCPQPPRRHRDSKSPVDVRIAVVAPFALRDPNLRENNSRRGLSFSQHRGPSDAAVGRTEASCRQTANYPEESKRMAPTDDSHAAEAKSVPDHPIAGHAASLRPSPEESSERRRLDLECHRLQQTRASLERLCMELQQELLDSECRLQCATTQIRLLRRDAERRHREFADARRRIRVLQKDQDHRDREYANARRRISLLQNDAEQRDREYANARHRLRLLMNNAERRDREFAKARHRVSLLLHEAEQRDREYARVRAHLRSLKHLSTGLAAAFLAITKTRRWRLGNTLLSIPSRVVGRRPTTVADDQHALATALAGGQMPPPTDSTGHANVGPDADG